MKGIVKSLIYLFIGSIVITVNKTNGQVAIGITNPNASAMLEINSNSRGLLIPRMTSTQISNISFPAKGLLIYQTDGVEGFYYNAGIPPLPVWNHLAPSAGQSGTVTSIQTGVGLTGGPITTSGTISALNSTALWNANKIQGIGISTNPPLNGQVLQYNGTDWGGTTINNANTSLSNLTTTTINQSLIPINSGTWDLGSNTFPWKSLWLAGSLNMNIPYDAGGISINHTGPGGPPLQAVINSASNSSICLKAQTYGVGRTCEFDNFNVSNPNSLMYLSNAGSGKWIDAGGNAYLSSGGTTWVNSSDIKMKENIKPVDGKLLLAKINELPIYQWSYKNDINKSNHIGPMAQDFYSLFNLGNDNTSISTIDPAGISLVGIKELAREVEKLKNEIANLKIELEKVTSLTKGAANK